MTNILVDVLKIILNRCDVIFENQTSVAEKINQYICISFIK